MAHLPRPPEGPLDAAFVTPVSLHEAAYFAAKLLPRLTPAAQIWIVFDATVGDWQDLNDAMQALGLTKSASVQLGPQLQSEAFARASMG